MRKSNLSKRNKKNKYQLIMRSMNLKLCKETIDKIQRKIKMMTVNLENNKTKVIKDLQSYHF